VGERVRKRARASGAGIVSRLPGKKRKQVMTAEVEVGLAVVVVFEMVQVVVFEMVVVVLFELPW
jgi:hypothetical protein